MAPVNDSGGGNGYPEDLPSPGKGILVHHDVLKNVHKLLHDDLTELKSRGRGTLNDLQADEKGRISRAELGNYPATQGLAMTTKNAYDQIGNVYSQFLTAYESLIDSIKQAADTHRETEQTNAAGFDRMHTGGSPTNSGSQFYA
ncbi:hypothetical protein [Actinomadura sp. HBU206391]|uniref:hypothetical protein n=1 Tax=Actinomadura sp. HBU206391 TaxID=2731692 RepID=UPI001650319A|nr:hypothetical protein [Actinomadura sp. HBU206391]MBC6457980.1 hypothetical protein [Actinomadura sp. HBU206391]